MALIGLHHYLLSKGLNAYISFWFVLKINHKSHFLPSTRSSSEQHHQSFNTKTIATLPGFNQIKIKLNLIDLIDEGEVYEGGERDGKILTLRKGTFKNLYSTNKTSGQ